MGDFESHGLLVDVAGVQVLDRPALLPGGALRGLAQLIRDAFGIVPEVFEQNLADPQQPFEAAHITDGAERSMADDAVEAAQHPCDLVAIMCYKTVHGVLLRERLKCLWPFYFFEDAVSIFTQCGLATAGRFGCG